MKLSKGRVFGIRVTTNEKNGCRLFADVPTITLGNGRSIGYVNVREQGSGKRGTAKVVLDPERALLVRDAFRMYATGDYSLAEMQSALAAKGLTSPTARKPGAPPPVSALATMLANPFYIGIVEWDGVRYPGKHKPLIPKNLFERCQEVLKAHNKAGVRQRRHDHYLKGVLYCGQCWR